MSEHKKVDKLTFTGNNYFCSAKYRPECIRSVSKNHPESNLCCLYCEGTTIEKCIEHNKKLNIKVKPCNTYDIGLDEFCEYSI